MDNEINPTPEKKPKRPRISASRGIMNDEPRRFGYNSEGTTGHNVSENTPVNTQENSTVQGTYQRRPYNPNGFQRPGSYQQRSYNNRPGGYQQRPNPYYNRDNDNPEVSSTDGNGDGVKFSGGYQQRGYNNNRQQGGYNNYRQNSYNNRQGGYSNNRQGGYQQRDGGFHQQADSQNIGQTPDSQNFAQQTERQGYHQGGYNNRQPGNNNRMGGYNNNRQGTYSNTSRQGGYSNNRQGSGYGSNNRQGGYGNNNRQGGYNNRNTNNRYNNRGHGGYNRPGGFPGKGKSFTPRPKAVEYELEIPDPNESIRLNKYMANAGICSRREADEFIQQGLVKVNGNIVTELGTKIKHSDVVEYDEKVVALERKCYILLNKPKDCVTTSDDPNGRTTVMDLVKGACNERIYPVGRLDRNTTGVLLLTNDGDLASKLTHPKYIKKKIYHVWTDHDITEEDMQRIADGIELDDGEIHADAISYANETDRNQAGIEIHSGRNRIVRRIFESLGYHVTKLDRVYFAGLTKKNLPRGRWRYLTQEEVNYLKMGSFE